MLLVPNPLNVFAVQGVTDMRKSFSGLVGLVENQLGQQVESGHLFLFFNRRRNSVKVLYFVGDGLVIYYRRLERGTFELPQRMRASPTSIEPPAATAKPRRRTPKRFVFPQGLPCRRTEHPLDTAELPCSCCQPPRVVIGTHVSRQLELEPAHAYVVEHVRYTYACAKCRSGQSLHTTAKPPLPIEKSPFGPSVLAAISVDKYARQLPLYRQQESLLGPLQTWLSRSLLCRLLRGVAEAVNYALHRRPTLVRYLDDGDLSIDTNHVEREIRPLAIGRTNWSRTGRGYSFGVVYRVAECAVAAGRLVAVPDRCVAWPAGGGARRRGGCGRVLARSLVSGTSAASFTRARTRVARRSAPPPGVLAPPDDGVPASVTTIPTTWANARWFHCLD